MANHEKKSNNRRAYDQWRVASPWLRISAQAIDQGLVAFFTGSLLSFLYSDKIFSTAWWLTWLLFWPFFSISAQSVFLYFFETTPGKKAFGLKVRSAHPNEDLGAWQILVRASAWWLGAFTLGAGFSQILSRSDRRAWHDIVAETVVIDQAARVSKSTALEKKLAHGWILSVSFVLISAMTTTLLVQMDRLRKNPSNSAKFSSLTPPPTLEDHTWTLVSNPGSLIDYFPKSGEEAKLLAIVNNFTKGLDLSFEDRKDFYTESMEPDEKHLCLNPHTSVSSCQTAIFLGQLLTSAPTKELPADVYASVVLLKQLGEALSSEEKIRMLKNQALNAPLLSYKYLALRLAQARELVNSADFKTASYTLTPDIEYLNQESYKAHSHTELEAKLSNQLTLMFCRAYAYQDCKKEVHQACRQNPFWSYFHSGCQLNTPSESFAHQSEGLGYWWNRATRPGADFNLNHWEKFKENLNDDAPETMEIVSALDLALAVKSSDPKELVERAQRLVPKNHLWGWAHYQAIQRFGEAWTYLLKDPEKDLIALYEFKPKDVQRIVATKKHSKKKLKKHKEIKKKRKNR